MKLTWGEPFWPSQSPPQPEYPQLDSDLTTDVLVIGAGVSGALVAHALTREGLDVVAVDKREPGCGSTAASTSLLLYELDTPLFKLADLIGFQQASTCYRLGVEAIDHLGQLVAELGDDCGYVRRKSIYLCAREEDLADLQREFVARRQCGLQVDLLASQDITSMFGFHRAGAILSHHGGEMDPYRLTHQVLKASMQRGLRVFARTAIERTENLGNRSRAYTTHGPAITARHVIYATGYEAVAQVGGDIANAQITYAAASEPVSAFPGWWEQCLIWETARPYLYFRTTPDSRILIGGLDDPDLSHQNDRDRLIEKARGLERKFSELFPRIPFRCDAAWAGVFETTPDGLPYIGPHPRFPGCLFALGYGGNGLTFSMIAADILRDLCMGRSNPLVNLFRFGRSGT